MAHNYILQVTAGPTYDPADHTIVPVNTATPIHVSSEHAEVDLNVRVQDYRGLPRESPTTSPYFSLPSHSRNGDQYSICFSFTPKTTINANDLVFGNDFDHPIRDRLPPGFGTAFKIVKWGIDPGLDGDVYAEKPYLYGPLGSSMNTLTFGEMGAKDLGLGGEGHEHVGLVFEEGGPGEDEEIRQEHDVPLGDAARKKWFLNEENRKRFNFKEGRVVGCDFFNAYLDFNGFALRLPGFTLPIMKYWDGQGLRYVLKNRATDEVLFVCLFTLYLKEDVNEDGSIKEGVEGGKPHALTNGEGGKDDSAKEDVPEMAPVVETSPDDLD